MAYMRQENVRMHHIFFTRLAHFCIYLLLLLRQVIMSDRQCAFYDHVIVKSKPIKYVWEKYSL